MGLGADPGSGKSNHLPGGSEHRLEHLSRHGRRQASGRKTLRLGEDELEFLEDLRWLPDGSGFVFSSTTLGDEHAGNISRFDLATKQRILLTNFKEHLIGQMSVSPDGRWITFERPASRDAETADIWIVGTDGKNLRLLVKDGWSPAWSK